jgi:hypothetical protein
MQHGSLHGGGMNTRVWDEYGDCVSAAITKIDAQVYMKLIKILFIFKIFLETSFE